MFVTIPECRPVILGATVLENPGGSSHQMVRDPEVAERLSFIEFVEVNLMFYSATQSLMIVQVQKAEQTGYGLGTPTNQVDRSRQPQSRPTGRPTSAAAPTGTWYWPTPKANAVGKA